MKLQTIVDDQIFFNKTAWLIISLIIVASFILTIYLCACCDKANVRKSKSPFSMIEKKSKLKATKTNVKIKKFNVKTNTSSSKEKRSKQSDIVYKEKSLRASIKSSVVTNITKEFDKTQSEKSPKNEVPEGKRLEISNDKLKTADKSIKIYDQKQITKRQERPESNGYEILDEEQRQVDNEAIKKRVMKQCVKQGNFGDTPFMMAPKQKKHNFSYVWKPPDSGKAYNFYTILLIFDLFFVV